MRFRWPNLNFWNLDFYHKAVCPTITIVLTILAIIAAWKVLGVHQETAERTKKELENRIEKLVEFNNKLGEAQKTLKEQQDRLEAHNTTIMAQSAAINSIGGGLLDFPVTEADRLGTHLANMNYSISLLARLHSRNPSYTSDEQSLFKTINDLNWVERDMNTAFIKYFKELRQSCKQLQKDYETAVKDVPNDRREELTRKLNQDVKLLGERFELQVAKAYASYASKHKELDATQEEIIQRLKKAEPHEETKRKIEEIQKK